LIVTSPDPLMPILPPSTTMSPLLFIVIDATHQHDLIPASI
jgi:hypothetical protein